MSPYQMNMQWLISYCNKPKVKCRIEQTTLLFLFSTKNFAIKIYSLFQNFSKETKCDM